MSDGISVYECTSNDEVIDLLSGGQGVFGIALGGVWRSIEGTLSALPAERAEPEPEATPSSGDELSAPPPRPRRRLTPTSLSARPSCARRSLTTSSDRAGECTTQG